MMTRIRFATENDVETITGFIRALAAYEKLSHECLTEAASLKQYLFGDRRYAEVILIEENGTPAGFALFFHNFSTFLGKPGIYLEDLFVDPDHRGKGYGKDLLKHLAGIAVARGCGRLEWSVLNWNQPAIDFYLSLGAAPVSGWTVHRLDGNKLTALAQA